MTLQIRLRLRLLYSLNADGDLCTVQAYNLALFASLLQDSEMGNGIASVMKNSCTLNEGNKMPHCEEKDAIMLWYCLYFVACTKTTS